MPRILPALPTNVGPHQRHNTVITSDIVWEQYHVVASYPRTLENARYGIGIKARQRSDTSRGNPSARSFAF